MHVHLIGICGTGMGALAGLLREAGHRVTGSDTAFYPPMGDALRDWGVETMQGFDPAHLEPKPDLVVVGNMCRRDNVEARAAIDSGIRHASFPRTVAELFLGNHPSYVVAGTHGKTTTSALLAFLLDACGEKPGFLIGGVPRDFDHSFRRGDKGAPFVIEGDEYDSAFFEKTPKFWQYAPTAAILTSIEHDHVDIYPDLDAYRAAFVKFVEMIPDDGVLVAFAGDPEVRAVAKHARCRVRYYALESDDCGEVVPEWTGALVRCDEDEQPFDLFVGGSSIGRVFSQLAGKHNARNAIAALALMIEARGVPTNQAISALRRFRGVRRRQELRGVADGVRIYDDFAHHPTAVRETLDAIRSRHGHGKLIAIFEPRSATASRRVHQEEYADAFRSADLAVLAPVGRPEIAESERLDVGMVAREITESGRRAIAPSSIDAIVRAVVDNAAPGDTVVVMSNGAFGGIHDRLLAALTGRRVHANVTEAHQ